MTDLLRRRVAQLEQKLDGLVTLLTSNQIDPLMPPLDQASNIFVPRSPVSLDSNTPTAEPPTATPQSNNSNGETNAVDTLNVSIDPADPISSGTAGAFSVTSTKPSQLEQDEHESEIMLREFKTNLAEQFPFVVIHPDSKSRSLRNERPLLWKAIMVASSHGASDRQMARGADLMEDLTKRLLSIAEKSLDLLQALLLFIAWY